MTQLYDDTGKVTGYYLTVSEYEQLKAMEEKAKQLIYEWARTAITDEELDAAEAADTEEYTTEEVLKYMESL
jgi:hypothetical protein